MRQLRRATDRFHTHSTTIDTYHSFSYGSHYDPDNVGFGPVAAINDENLAPGAGYSAHRHSEVEIITWVLSGTLRHADSTGASGSITPGLAQRLSSGSGVEHTEVNASATEPLRFLQIMLRSSYDGEPRYDQHLTPAQPGLHDLLTVQAPAQLKLLRLAAGQTIELPPAPRTYLQLTRGAVRIQTTDLHEFDALATDENVGEITAEVTTEALVLFLRP